MLLLATDVGNTEIKLGIFAKERLGASWRWSSDRAKTADEYAALLAWALERDSLSLTAIEGAVLCSVVPELTRTFQELIRHFLRREPLVVSADVDTVVALRVDNPHEVGGDRIANAVAASALYGAPAIIVDFGTATNFDVISADGALVGASFAPGLLTAVDGMLARAARLQRFDLVAPPKTIGTNTNACLQSGTIYGYVGLVEGLVRRIKNELGMEARVIGTGGLVDLIAAETDTIQLVDRDLTLQGLRLIAERNGVRGLRRQSPRSQTTEDH